jgi:hypothetical protein
MSPRNLLQIVPRLPPPEEALGQVAARLEERFQRHGVDASTIPAAPDRAAFARALAAAPPDSTVLLHYVGYGYARRGAPLWLALRLEAWLRDGPRRRLLVHFHEFAATGPPWRSSFWLAPLQRRVAGRLARAACGAITSLDRDAARLREAAPRLRLEVLPIFSAIGEPERVASWAERGSTLALFGSRGARGTIWTGHLRDLQQAAEELEVSKVVEIGRSEDLRIDVGGRPVERTGELESSEAGAILGRARAAFFASPLEYLDKSSAFAAACAHGALPVCAGRRDGPGPAPGEGERWVAAARLGGTGEEARSAIAGNARAWYLGHDLARHARTWLEQLGT